MYMYIYIYIYTYIKKLFHILLTLLMEGHIALLVNDFSLVYYNEPWVSGAAGTLARMDDRPCKDVRRAVQKTFRNALR